MTNSPDSIAPLIGSVVAGGRNTWSSSPSGGGTGDMQGCEGDVVALWPTMAKPFRLPLAGLGRNPTDPGADPPLE
ncbi:hypothetical protein ACQRIU_005724 [Beauveria bassiana]